MTKKSGKGYKVKTKEDKPEVLFSDDAMMVDYLNALLTSEPTTNLELGEIHILQQAIEAGWKPAEFSSSVVDTASYFEKELSKMEAAALRNENETLKFKTELATIDSQVLRTENDKLKVKVTSLMEQLNESQYSLDMSLAENSNLKLRLVALQNQLDSATETALHATSQVLVDPDIKVNNTTDRYIVSDLESIDSKENIDSVTDQKDTPELNHSLPQNTLPYETIEKISPDPEIVQNNSMNGHAALSIAPDTAMLWRQSVENDESCRHTSHNRVISPLKQVMTESTIQNIKPTSRIIKQHHIQNYQGIHGADQVLEVISLNPVQNDVTNLEASLKPALVQPQHIEEPESRQADDSDSQNDSLHAFDSDEINLEPAPDPKVVVRRNVKNYEEIQKEADSANAPSAGHTIIS